MTDAHHITAVMNGGSALPEMRAECPRGACMSTHCRLHLQQRECANGRGNFLQAVTVDPSRPTCAAHVVDGLEPRPAPGPDRGTTPVNGMAIAAIARLVWRSDTAVKKALARFRAALDRAVEDAPDVEHDDRVASALASVDALAERCARLRFNIPADTSYQPRHAAERNPAQ